MLYNNGTRSAHAFVVRDQPPANFTRKVSDKLDRTAVALSGICLVHCLALPLAIALFPLLGTTLIGHDTFHQLILIVVLPTTVVALAMGYRHHRSLWVAALGFLGAAALVFAAFAVHALHGENLERWVTVAGGVTLALAHIGNFRLCRHAHGAAGGAIKAH